MLIQTKLACKWCTSSDAMCEYTDGWYCFSCGKAEKKDTPDIAPIPKMYREPKLPHDFTFEIPDVFKQWYRQYGIRNIDVEEFGWSDYWQSIIIPIQGPLAIEGWIGRNFNKNIEKKYHLCRGKTPLIYKIEGVLLEIVIITEDILSAIKIHQTAPHEVTKWAALGTGSNHLVQEIKKINPKKVLIWLDGDEAGQRGARKLYKKLNSFIDCDIVTTTRDPKEYSHKEIDRILEAHL